MYLPKKCIVNFLYFIFLSLCLIYENPVNSVQAKSNCLPKTFVYLDEIDPTIEQLILFACKNNHSGRPPLDGYNTKRAICTREAACALSKAQKEFQHYGLSLKVTDAYRPTQAVKHLKNWHKKSINQKKNKKHSQNLKAKKKLKKFVATQRSPHSRGSSFDVIIINNHTKKNLDFGPATFGKEASACSLSVTPEQHKNRLLLRKIMIHNNFKPYDLEWWHFTLKNEPYPNTYFDFPIQ